MLYHQKLMQIIVRTPIKLTAMEKLVLVALANFTNEFGFAYPTRKQICECTDLSESSVSRALTMSEKRGIILRSKGHRGRATTYQFTCFRELKNADELLGVSQTHQERHTRLREFNFVKNNNLSAWGVSQTLIRQSFDKFWEMYPKKVGKFYAYHALIEATKSTDVYEILDGLSDFIEQVAYGLDQQFIPHPANWLEGERWLDEYS